MLGWHRLPGLAGMHTQSCLVNALHQATLEGPYNHQKHTVEVPHAPTHTHTHTTQLLNPCATSNPNAPWTPTPRRCTPAAATQPPCPQVPLYTQAGLPPTHEQASTRTQYTGAPTYRTGAPITAQSTLSQRSAMSPCCAGHPRLSTASPGPVPNYSSAGPQGAPYEGHAPGAIRHQHL